MDDYRARFDPEGRMNWGAEPTDFPSAWWWDTSAWPQVELKVHSNLPHQRYLSIGSIDASDPDARFQLNAVNGSNASGSLTALGEARWLFRDGAGGEALLDLNQAFGELTSAGRQALQAALQLAAADIGAQPPSGFTGTTVQALLDEYALRLNQPTVAAIGGGPSSAITLARAAAQVVIFDSSAGAVAVTLPVDPAEGDRVQLYAVGGLDALDVGQPLPFALTLHAPSAVIDGLGSSEALGELVAHFHLRFDASARAWQVGL